MPRMRMCVLFLLAVCLGGCTTVKRVDWESRVGKFSFDQVVLEMGPPDKETILSDGTKVAEWRTRRGMSRTTFLGDPYSGISTPAYSYTGPDRFLRLQFGADGKLTQAKRVYR
ncbi:MAG: hypothetical protein CMO80_05295 [Verrucomicrobiales bacterium]|nr:hypothetical protein [Verrucomicrobiales bacterium]|tara:strand:- start:4235 stop:4573 length:339 start_codon:yes stop_codon:yes gene_type:complete